MGGAVAAEEGLFFAPYGCHGQLEADSIARAPGADRTCPARDAPGNDQRPVAARAFIQLADPSIGFLDGESADGRGATTNVWTFWQRCPHLGCKPNFCTSNYWFECPCHGSRYDRLGTKVEELGPAPRGLDRFSHVVKDGELIVDTGKITLGPLPVALGQPGLIPAKSPTGCL